MLTSGRDILLNEEEKLVKESIKQFAEDKVKPLARKIDAEHYYPTELIPELAELGLLSVFVPSEYGGSGMNNISYSLIIEELATVCASTSVIVSAHNSLAIWPILKFGTTEQKKQYLPLMCTGKSIGCFALSEPGTGSDAARQTCTAKEDGDDFIINGVKNWITNAPVSDVCILLTMEDASKDHKGITAFIVDLKTTEGISIGHKENKLGICGSPTASITFDQVRISKKQLLGERGKGFRVAMETLDGGRIGIAAQACGIASASLNDALRYSTERETFGVKISEHQMIQTYLADMATDLEAARLLTYTAAKMKDEGMQYSKMAAQAKLFSSEVCMRNSHLAVQIHGGYGFVKDFNVERYMRDAKITEIYEGTSEIQRLVIAANLIKEQSN